MTRVKTTIADYIAHVELNRPDKMNAVDQEMIDELIAAGKALAESDVRAVILSGVGKAFCSGLDVMSFAKLAAGDPHELLMPRTHGDTNDFQEVAMIWNRLPVPVIAALHGPTFGAGFQIALGADMRIAAPDTQCAIMEMKWGIIPDMGAMVLLPRLTRSDIIRKLTYLATPISAEEARDFGLVTEVTDAPLLRARELAQEIAGKSPSAIRAAKRLINFAETMETNGEVLLAESCEQAELIGKPHQLEVIAANMAKRAPAFK